MKRSGFQIMPIHPRHAPARLYLNYLQYLLALHVHAIDHYAAPLTWQMERSRQGHQTTSPPRQREMSSCS